MVVRVRFERYCQKRDFTALIAVKPPRLKSTRWICVFITPGSDAFEDEQAALEGLQEANAFIFVHSVEQGDLTQPETAMEY